MSVPIGTGDGDPDTQAAFAATLVDEWVRGGVAHAVVCPGSRSTPLALALAAHPAVTVHVRLDERSAGFTALGIGLGTGLPALVVTTSGTAAAELHAAVVEADLAAVPLIACTADRPAELRGVGAPQTIDQHGLFGSSVRWFCDPGVPGPATRGAWRSLSARSVAEAVSGGAGPGPVHLNLPFREPLLGDPDVGGVPPGRPDGRPWHRVVASGTGPDRGGVRVVVGSDRLDPTARGLIVAGAGCGDPAAVLGLAEAWGWPVLADPRSGVRLSRPGVIGAADGILRSEVFADRQVPEVVVQLGDRWVSKVVNGFLSSAAASGAEAIVVDPFGRWRDPERSTSTFVRADPSAFCAGLATGSTGVWDTTAGGWGRAWQAAESAAQAAMAGALGDGGLLTEASLAHRLWGHLPAEATLVVSSSMPVRDLEAFASPRADPPRVLANRGANGIDGVVSTALGVALASGHPTVALVGDLAFLHDVSALVRAEGPAVPLTVVVADNQGGGIFSFLDPATALDPGTFETLFGTRQASDVARVAAGFDWPVDQCGTERSGELEAILDRRLAERSLSVIRVGLPDRADNVVHHRRVNAAIVDAVDRLQS